jgi:hypothetical protein
MKNAIKWRLIDCLEEQKSHVKSPQAGSALGTSKMHFRCAEKAIGTIFIGNNNVFDKIYAIYKNTTSFSKLNVSSFS